MFLKREMLGCQRSGCKKFVKTPVLILAMGYVIIIQMKLFKLVKNHKSLRYKYIEGTRSKV